MWICVCVLIKSINFIGVKLKKIQSKSMKQLLIAILIMLPYIANTQDSNKINDINIKKLFIIGGTTVVGFSYAYLLQDNMWWKGTQSDFHFNNHQDYEYALNADKYAHFHFGYLSSKIYSDLFQWTGFNKKQSHIYAGLLAFTFQTFTEIRDGFSEQYGFSWGDCTANFLGAVYPNLQYYYPFLKAYNFRISYSASQPYKNGEYSYIFDDYQSTYQWLSIDINRLLPNSASKYFPDFIDFAIGYSVKNIDAHGAGNHEVFLSLDWDFEAIPISGKFWNTLKHTLNYYHFPAPAVKIYPNIVWYGLKF